MTRKSKSLHNIVIEGCSINTKLSYNINTDHIGIGTIQQYKYILRPLNKKSSNYLGITCAEEVLNQVFKNVEVMPFGNPGYDFVCNNGFLIDSKASCKHISNKQSDNWLFAINKNKIPDYFALLAFDNRTNINPLYFWLIPGHIINDKITTTISESTINKWNKYRQDISKVIKCCNNLKGE